MPMALQDWQNGYRPQSEVLITDTTFRDAHQSLFATRLRTNDMMKVAAATAGKTSKPFLIRMLGRRYL